MPLPLITSQHKDGVLKLICDNAPLDQLCSVSNFDEFRAIVGEDINRTFAILKDFQEMGLLDRLDCNRRRIFLSLTVKAHDLLQRGGFAVMDALNEANMQKLLYELDVLKRQLQPDQTETLNKVTTIMASIATVVQAFSDKP